MGLPAKTNSSRFPPEKVDVRLLKEAHNPNVVVLVQAMPSWVVVHGKVLTKCSMSGTPVCSSTRVAQLLLQKQ